MKKNLKRNIVLVLVVLLSIGIAGISFAGWGKGNCQGRGNKANCSSNCQNGTQGQYQGVELSEEVIAKIAEQRKAFYEATSDLKQGMQQKGFELKSELTKKTVDVKKAKKIQAEISDLRATLAQKRLDHMIKMKEINPNFKSYMSGKGGRGQGRGSRGQGCGQQYGQQQGQSQQGSGQQQTQSE